MPTFIQLSKHQKKALNHHIAMCRRMNAHDQKFPSQEAQRLAAQAREAEIKALIAQQGRDRAFEAQQTANIEETRKANAQEWQEQRKGLVIRRKSVMAETFGDLNNA